MLPGGGNLIIDSAHGQFAGSGMAGLLTQRSDGKFELLEVLLPGILVDVAAESFAHELAHRAILLLGQAFSLFGHVRGHRDRIDSSLVRIIYSV